MLKKFIINVLTCAVKSVYWLYETQEENRKDIIMKKLLCMLLPLAAAISISGCSGSDGTSGNSEAQASSASSSVQTSGGAGFRVDGTKLLDANGNEFVMRGINHAHTWFKDQAAVAVPAIADTGSNAVRLVFSDGQQWEKDDLASVKSLIEQCRELDMIAIVEVHDGTGKDDTGYLENAADYWIEMKDALIGNEDHVILNIANEWVGQWDGKLWRDGYVSVIPKLREAGISNTIMVDAAGWGQYGQSIADYGQEVFDSDPNKNTMFSIHMYGSAGGSETSIKKNLEGVTGQGLCVCVGEFGYTHSDGDVDGAFLMKYCTENNIGYMGWSWKGNGGGVEYLDIAQEWDGSKLSSDWGDVLINGENGIKSTARKCSIFE